MVIRVKPPLNQIFSPLKGAFAISKLIINNIFLGLEFMHSLTVVKLDMEKAYDRE